MQKCDKNICPNVIALQIDCFNDKEINKIINGPICKKKNVGKTFLSV